MANEHSWPHVHMHVPACAHVYAPCSCFVQGVVTGREWWDRVLRVGVAEKNGFILNTCFKSVLDTKI